MSTLEQSKLCNVVLEVVQELCPAELDYIELSGERIVAALVAGEDVRKTFNKRQITGSIGLDGHLAIEIVRSLNTAWTVYKMYRAIRAYLKPPAPVPASLRESIVLGLIDEGYSSNDAPRVATVIFKSLSKEFGGPRDGQA